MIRFLAAIGLLATGLTTLRENPDAAAFAAVAAAVLCLWLASDRHWWRDNFRKLRRIDAIPDTRTVRRLLLVLLSNATGLGLLGVAQLSDVGLLPASVHLDRLEMAGWVTGEWEPEPPFGTRRRFYRLTAT